ncbi:MAG: Flp family type IVb pilin [Proteobacteria bacterium]|nr:Flp family type IVb pilin [Pseudomonadota bacterium]
MNCQKKSAPVADIQKQEGEKQKGATMVEYALLIALIAVVAIVSLQGLSGNMSTKFSSVGSSVVGATN